MNLNDEGEELLREFEDIELQRTAWWNKLRRYTRRTDDIGFIVADRLTEIKDRLK